MDINKINTRVLPIKFQYLAPKTLEEVVSFLAKHGEETKVLAGGTDLLVKMKQRLIEPTYILNIKEIKELSFIKSNGNSLNIGATTKLNELENSRIIKEKFIALHEAVKAMGSVQIRNMGTVGGNLCNASPAADLAPPLLVLNSKVKAVSTEGEREIPLNKFFLGPGKTSLKPNELLTEIQIPYLPEDTGTSFLKVARTSMDLAKVNVATVLKLKNGKVENCRIALGSVAPTPLRVCEAEKVLLNSEFTAEKVEETAEKASQEIKPITDVRSTAEYRKEVSKILVRRALQKAYERIKVRECG